MPRSRQFVAGVPPDSWEARRTSTLGAGGRIPAMAAYLGAIGFALCWGMAIALFDGVIAAVALFIASGALLVMWNYRIGIWLSILLLPFSGTQLIPRQMFGVTGLNPLNIILGITLMSLFVAHLFDQRQVRLPRTPRLLGWYVLMLSAAAVYGSFFVNLAIPHIGESGAIEFLTVKNYLLAVWVKPMIILLVAMLAGSISRSSRGARAMVWAVGLSIALMTAVVLVSVFASGMNLNLLAETRARGFLSWTGMHANDIGFFFSMGCALLLFAALGHTHMGEKALLLLLAGAAGTAAALTFSRGTFLGLLVIVAYFLVSRRKFGPLAVALIALTIIALSLPDAFVERATTGITHGSAQDLSAGRVERIWKPLIPEILKSPFVGHGLQSISWADPNRRGAMLGVTVAHSAYLETLLDTGLLGLIMVAAVLHLLWRMFRRLKIIHPEGLWRGYFEGASVCILVLLVQGMTAGTFFPSFPQSFLWVSAGLGLGFLDLLKHQQSLELPAQPG